MALKKRVSRVLESAGKRLAGLRSISDELDLGNGLNNAAFQALLDETRQSINDYNTRLSEVDGLQNVVEENERKVRDFSERVLAGVAASYGKNSDEYMKAGGVKKSERKRPRRKTASETMA